MFSFRPGSKFNTPLPAQRDALASIEASDRSGIVVLPCGAGKTFLILNQALKCMNTLILCYEAQGVIQIREALLNETTWPAALVQAFTHELRGDRPAEAASIVITTYGMFSGSLDRRAKATENIGETIFEKQWDLLLLDEVHHAPAETYEPFIRRLVPNVTRVLGFTGTLTRELSPNMLESIRRGKRTREECIESMFRFLLPEGTEESLVLYRRSLEELERDAAVAKVSVCRVMTPFCGSFETAHNRAEGYTRKYIAATHAHKLKVLHAIVQLHTARGDIGIVFCDHLFPTRIVSELLGSTWGVLRGSSSTSEADVRISAKENRKVIEKLNRKELDGVIGTSVIQSSVDLDHPDLCYAILCDGHGGDAASSQKTGRLARTPVPVPVPGETDSQIVERRRDTQKRAVFYELITPNTEEETAGKLRMQCYKRECRKVVELTDTSLIEAASTLGMAACPTDSYSGNLRVLLAALAETEFVSTERLVRERARQVLRPHRDAIRSFESKAATARNSLMKKRHADTAARLKKQTSQRRTASIQAERQNEALRLAPPILLEVIVALGISPQDVRDVGFKFKNL